MRATTRVAASVREFVPASLRRSALACGFHRAVGPVCGCRVCKISLPLWHHFIFILLYWSEFFLKVTAFGFNGGKFSYWTQNFYNKLDIVATVTYLPEVVTVVIYGASPISCRGLRLLRLFKPVGQLGLFSDLETIFESIIDAMAPMGVVMSLILFVLVLYGIIGMTLYSRSFRRRCVWADNLQIKVPEQYCERVPGSVQYPSCLATGKLRNCARFICVIFARETVSSSCGLFARAKGGGRGAVRGRA